MSNLKDTIQVPLPNGMTLTFSKTNSTEPSGVVPEVSGLSASVEEMKEISVALLYYKAYLQQKGQTEKAEFIKTIDDRIFELLNTSRQQGIA